MCVAVCDHDERQAPLFWICIHTTRSGALPCLATFAIPWHHSIAELIASRPPCRHCPGTAALLRKLPSLRTALFSRLGPDTKLSGHTGWEDLANFVLRCHLTVKTPAGRCCGTWVEGEVRFHSRRDFIVFDDSKIHKAFNLHPTESRIVLILDMARPHDVPVGVAQGGHTPELDSFIDAFR
jgi:hypothetical protein